jgi:hypothetical protein
MKCVFLFIAPLQGLITKKTFQHRAAPCANILCPFRASIPKDEMIIEKG